MLVFAEMISIPKAFAQAQQSRMEKPLEELMASGWAVPDMIGIGVGEPPHQET